MRIRILALLSLHASLAVAQSVILPSALATQPPPTGAINVETFGLQDSHTQYAYDVNDITTPVATWVSLQVRHPAGLPSVTSTPYVTNATIVLAVSPLAPAAMSTTFATNLVGTNPPVTVFTGQLSLSMAGYASWPAPWEPAVPFTAPFLYIRPFGLSLIVDIVQTGTSSNFPCFVEAWRPDSGSTRSVSTPWGQCVLANGTRMSIKQSSPFPFLGANWALTYAGTPTTAGPITAPAFALLGASGPGGTWGGIPLPLDLRPFGAPCAWSISGDLVVPMLASATGPSVSCSIPVPNQPNLGGQTIYEQGVILDPAANALGVVVTASGSWVIGTPYGAPAAMNLRTGAGSATAPIGNVAKSAALAIKLN